MTEGPEHPVNGPERTGPPAPTQPTERPGGGDAGRLDPGVWVGQGARRVEARLVAEVRAWHDAMRADPSHLARPLCIVVPSRSLKDHVSAVLVRALGTLAGVEVQTHYGLALRTLERAGARAPVGSELLPVLVRQLARDVPSLRAELDDLDDGYGAVAMAVSDLLDAGLDEATAEAARERLAERADPVAVRALGVVEVARAVRRAFADHGLGRLADVLVRAREALEDDPALFAPGAVVLHGFADATGLVSDFLAGIARGHEGRVLLDRPPDPADPSQPDLGAVFARPLEERLAAATGRAPILDPEPPPARALRFFRAPGTDAEVRTVAWRVSRLIDEGVAPESIGIVTRTPAAYAPALRVQLDRLGIPASGVAVPGPRSALGRRIAFLLDLLRQRERMPADRLVLALRAFGPGQRADLRLGVHALGVARLADLAAAGVTAPLGDEDSFPLPARRGLATGGDPGDEGDAGEEGDGPRAGERGPRATRRHLGRALLEQARDRAAELARHFASAAERRPLGERLDACSQLVTATLGWRAAGAAAPLIARLETLRAELPAGLPVSLDELALLLDRALAGLVHEPLGGEGAGVQLLDVTEARARTFEHLFLLGLNRDRFPRVIAEDPLLPDEIREALQDVLPELAAKERGHEEERFLFAELVSSSPNVTVSWQLMGDDGKALAPSPLVERLISPRDEIERVPTLLARPGPDAAERTAHEWTLLAALHGGPAPALLPEALAAARGRPGEGAALVDEAAARTAAVAALDAVRGGDGRLGPYLGQVGAAREAADLRRGDVWVTTLEKIARCPWQGFLASLLRLERPPDALEALPEADALLVGSLVHDVLEAIVREHVPDAGARPIDAPPVPVPWPAPDRLEALLRRAARDLLFRNGIGLPGFASVLVERARPFLEVARAHDWGDGPVPVVGAEVATSLEVATPPGPLRVSFRADRVDRGPEGLRLTDYKTGASPKDTADEDKRFAELCARVRQGLLLQAPIYARVSPGARGRYLYLKPELEHDREFAVRDEAEAVAAFEAAVADVGGALAAGTLPPRLVGADGEEPAACGWCELSIACVRGDSGARRRVGEWAAAPASEDDPREAALRAIWSMGASS